MDTFFYKNAIPSKASGEDFKQIYFDTLMLEEGQRFTLKMLMDPYTVTLKGSDNEVHFPANFVPPRALQGEDEDSEANVAADVAEDQTRETIQLFAADLEVERPTKRRRLTPPPNNDGDEGV